MEVLLSLLFARGGSVGEPSKGIEEKRILLLKLFV